MLFHIDHETRLEFSQGVHHQYGELRMTPFSDALQTVRSASLTTDPSVPFRHYTDVFGNAVDCFEILPLHQGLVTRLRCEVETHMKNPFDYPLLEPAAETTWIQDALRRDPTLWQFVSYRSPATPAFETLKHKRAGVPTWDPAYSLQKSLLDAMNWTASVLSYVPGSTDTHTPLTEVVQEGKGVCQDFAHLFISLIRSWNLPARYVMGYTPEANATHAWAEVLVPGAGWRGFDATNLLVADETYVRVAVGRDSLDAAPQRGTFKGNAVTQSPFVKLLMTHPPSSEPLQVLVGTGPSVLQSAQ